MSMAKRERDVQAAVRVAASELGYTMFRNNVGVAWRKDGVPIRFGLCIGSSDLVGWRTIEITPEMVGETVAVFTAIEVKGRKGRLTREQARFLDVLRNSGGIVMVARGPEDLVE